MSLETWEVIGEEDWQQWRAQALDLVLPDWRGYEIREVVMRVPQESLESLFATHVIDAEMGA